MAFGVKIKSVKFNNSYTIESLYEAIKDKTFSAGVPSLVKHGMATIITFPALDSQNQVWILKSGFSAESPKFSVQKQQEAGIDNMVINAALDKVTGGVFGFGGVAGSTVKQCEKLVELTANELSAMNL